MFPSWIIYILLLLPIPTTLNIQSCPTTLFLNYLNILFIYLQLFILCYFSLFISLVNLSFTYKQRTDISWLLLSTNYLYFVTFSLILRR